jgi:hypothetical protein
MVRRSSAIAILAGLLLLPACGSDASSTAPPVSSQSLDELVAASADATQAAGSAKVAFDMRFSMDMAGTMTMRGTGAMDFDHNRGILRMRVAGGTVPQMTGELTQIIDGNVIYTRWPALTGDDHWLKMDLDAVAGQTGSPGLNSQSDPSLMLEWLRGASASITRVGEEDVRGTATTHYRAAVDLRQIADTAPADQREALRASIDQLVAQTGASTMPMEVWIDGDGVARRVAVKFEFSQSSAASMEMRMEFYDFGSDVRVTPPPPRQTVDWAAASGV